MFAPLTPGTQAELDERGDAMRSNPDTTKSKPSEESMKADSSSKKQEPDDEQLKKDLQQVCGEQIEVDDSMSPSPESPDPLVAAADGRDGSHAKESHHLEDPAEENC